MHLSIRINRYAVSLGCFSSIAAAASQPTPRIPLPSFVSELTRRDEFILFATSRSTASNFPRTFGQLVSLDSTMTTNLPAATCPCCSFIGGNLFLPSDDKKKYSSEPKDAMQVLDVMKPQDAWKVISENESNDKILLVDTHGHPHLQRDIQYANAVDENPLVDERVVSITCAVSPLDWKNALEYASKSLFVLPALGIHPWYLGDILSENDETEDIEKHLNWDWLAELEHHLSEHPNLIVGEIGLCKMARFVREFPKEKGGKATALQLQKLVFRKQMELAAKWSRPVTVHCVNMHGAFMEVLKDIAQKAKESYAISNREANHENISLHNFVRNAFPPSIAMHSFTGTSHHVQEILKFEDEIMNPTKSKRVSRKVKKHASTSEVNKRTIDNGSRRECLFFFGFSHAINHVMCTSDKARQKGMEAVCAVPPERLLVESDVHAMADVILGTAGAVAYIASAREEEMSCVAKRTTLNGLRYIGSLSLASQLMNDQ